jgi:hypothetical protein
VPVIRRKASATQTHESSSRTTIWRKVLVLAADALGAAVAATKPSALVGELALEFDLAEPVVM